MKLPLISALALTASLLVSGSAMAQTTTTDMAGTMFGSATLTAEELPLVQAHCDTLERLDNTGNSAGNDNKTAGASVESEAPAGEAALVTSIDLDTVTLEQCKEAGLVE
jgi:hypothetical protein